MLIRGAKLVLVWSDAANTPLQAFSAGALLCSKDHADSGGLPLMENFG